MDAQPIAQEQDDRGILERLMDENPLIKSGVKKIQSNQDEHIDQAMQVGVPSTEILKQLIVQHAPTSILAMGGASQEASGQIDIKQPSALMGFLFGNSAVNRDLNNLEKASQVQNQQTQGQLGQQQLLGQQPLQSGEKEKISLEQQGNIDLEEMKNKHNLLTNIKLQAQQAISQGQSLPGLTMDETKKAADVYIPEMKVVAADIAAAEKVGGIFGQIFGNKQAKNLMKKLVEQKTGKSALSEGKTKSGNTFRRL